MVARPVPSRMSRRSAQSSPRRASEVPPSAKGAASDDGGHPGAALEIREDRALQHDTHLVGNTRHGVDDLLAQRADETGRGPRHLGDAARTGRNVGLPEVAERHLAAPRLEVGAQVVRHRLIADEADPHGLGDGVAGDVVLGGAEPAAQDDRIGPPEGEAKGAHHALVVVPHLGLEVAVDAGERELPAHPRRVRIHDLSEQQLGADRDDLATHASSPAVGAAAILLLARDRLCRKGEIFTKS